MYDFSQRYPKIHPHTFIADSAQIIGRVILAEGASVWYNAVLRGDIEEILKKLSLVRTPISRITVLFMWREI